MRKTFRNTLIAAGIAGTSFGAYAGELYDPTAGQPTATVSQTGLTNSDAPFVVSAWDNQFVFMRNDAYNAEPATMQVAALRTPTVHDLYDNS